MNLKDAKETLEATEMAGDVDINKRKNKLAIMEIWAVYAYQVLVDAFGNVPAANSGTLISEALATGVFTDQSESAILVYYGIAPYVNSYYNEFVLIARKNFCPTNTLVDMMNTLNDPYRAVWFTQYPAGSGAYLELFITLTKRLTHRAQLLSFYSIFRFTSSSLVDVTLRILKTNFLILITSLFLGILPW